MNSVKGIEQNGEQAFRDSQISTEETTMCKCGALFGNHTLEPYTRKQKTIERSSAQAE